MRKTYIVALAIIFTLSLVSAQETPPKGPRTESKDEIKAIEREAVRQSKESLKKVKDVVDIKTKKIMQQRLLLMESDAELTEAMSLLRRLEKVNGTTPPPSIIFPPPRVLPGEEKPGEEKPPTEKVASGVGTDLTNPGALVANKNLPPAIKLANTEYWLTKLLQERAGELCDLKEKELDESKSKKDNQTSKTASRSLLQQIDGKIDKYIQIRIEVLSEMDAKP